MKSLLFLLLILYWVGTMPAKAQQFCLGWKAGKNTTGEVITTDRAGNVYVAGHVAGNTTFGSTSFSSPTNAQNVYIAKYDKDGVVQQVFRATGIASGNNDAYVTGLAVDFDGQMYITGYSGDFTLDQSLEVTGQSTMFLAKYNSTGTAQWVKTLTGIPGDCQGLGVTYDKGGGGLYVSGYYSGTVVMGTTTITTSSTSLHESFIARYNQNGVQQWVRPLGANIFVDDIAAQSGSVGVVGRFSNTATFGSTTFRARNTDLFVALYNSFGDLQWARQAGGPGYDGYLNQVKIAVNSTTTYITASMEANTTASFGPITLTTTGFFLAKYDSMGNIQWVKSDQGAASCKGLTIQSEKYDGDVYCTGDVSPYSPLLYIARYGSDGSRKWTRTVTSSGLQNWQHAWEFLDITISPYGDLYSTGNLAYSLSATFGSTTLTYENGDFLFGDTNMMVAKLYQEIPPDIYASGTNPYGSSEFSNYCGSNVSLSASSCSGTVTWYKRTRLFTVPTTYRWDLLATGNPYIIPPSNSVFQATCTVNGLTSPASSSLTTILLDIPTPTVSPVAATITSGSTATLIADGCPSPTVYQFNNGILANVFGYVEVSPTETTTYTTRCINGTCVGTSTNSTIVVRNPCPANTSISAQSGNWNTASTWFCGGIPTLTSTVQIKAGHVITINSAAYVKRLQFETTSKILYAPGGRLITGQ